MLKNKKLRLALLLSLAVLIAFLAFVFYQSTQPIAVSIDQSETFFIQDSKNVALAEWKNRAFETDNRRYLYNMSEQELMDKSQITLQAQEVKRANDLFFAKLYGLVDYGEQEITLNKITYAYQDLGREVDSLRRYKFVDAEDPISSENLTALVAKGQPLYRERNQAIWQSAGWAVGFYLVFVSIGLTLLFNLEAVSNGFVRLFIREAQPGPIIKFVFGLVGVSALASGFLVLFSVIDQLL